MPHNVLNNVALSIVEAHGSHTGTGTGTPVDVSSRYSCAFLIYFSAIAAGAVGDYFTFEIVEEAVSPFVSPVAVSDLNRIIEPSTGRAAYYKGLGTAAASNSEIFRSDKAADAPFAVIVEVTVALKQYMSVRWTETGTASQTFAIFSLANYTRRKPAL